MQSTRCVLLANSRLEPVQDEAGGASAVRSLRRSVVRIHSPRPTPQHPKNRSGRGFRRLETPAQREFGLVQLPSRSVQRSAESRERAAPSAAVPDQRSQAALTTPPRPRRSAETSGTPRITRPRPSSTPEPRRRLENGPDRRIPSRQPWTDTGWAHSGAPRRREDRAREAVTPVSRGCAPRSSRRPPSQASPVGRRRRQGGTQRGGSRLPTRR